MAVSRKVLSEQWNDNAENLVDRKSEGATLVPFVKDQSGDRDADEKSLFDREYNHLSVRYEQERSILWCYQKHGECPCFTPSLLADIRNLQTWLQETLRKPSRDESALRYVVWGSHAPGIYNLGGDLDLFVQLIKTQDRNGLHRYARACVDICYRNATDLRSPILTVALVQGDALGGGFEAVLSNDIIIAEEGSRFGLPEVLFNLFPGMGAYSFLVRRVAPSLARDIILSGKLYAAEELREMGVVDLIAPTGKGVAELRSFVDGNARRRPVLTALAQVGRVCQPLDYEELSAVTDIWVDTALCLEQSDLRRMGRLAAAQRHRRARSSMHA